MQKFGRGGGAQTWGVEKRGGKGKVDLYVAVGYSEGKGARGRCAPSCAEHERKFYLRLIVG